MSLAFTKGQVREEQPADRDYADHISRARECLAMALGRIVEAEQTAEKAKDFGLMDELDELRRDAATLWLRTVNLCEGKRR